jgi:hypothetical protein
MLLRTQEKILLAGFSAAVQSCPDGFLLSKEYYVEISYDIKKLRPS